MIYLQFNNNQYKEASRETCKMLKKALADKGDPIDAINEYISSCSSEVFEFILNIIVPTISFLMQYKMLDIMLWGPLQEKYSSLDRVIKKAAIIFSMDSDNKCTESIHRMNDYIDGDSTKTSRTKGIIKKSMKARIEEARNTYIELGLDGISEIDKSYMASGAVKHIREWTAQLKNHRDAAAFGVVNKKSIVIMNKKTHKKYLFSSRKECMKFLRINGREVFNRWLHGGNVRKCRDYIIVKQ